MQTDAVVRGLSAIIETCLDTGLLVGHMPGLPDAHSQGINWAELRANLEDVIALLRDGADPERIAPQAHALESAERQTGVQPPR